MKDLLIPCFEVVSVKQFGYSFNTLLYCSTGLLDFFIFLHNLANRLQENTVINMFSSPISSYFVFVSVPLTLIPQFPYLSDFLTVVS